MRIHEKVVKMFPRTSPGGGLRLIFAPEAGGRKFVFSWFSTAVGTRAKRTVTDPGGSHRRGAAG